MDFPSYLKTGDDMEFIDGLDPKWDGTLPASLLFDGQGKQLHLWSGTGHATQALDAEARTNAARQSQQRRKP